MIDLSNLGNYKENNRIEAKRATGGLPESIWESYSAFANTLGGVILLGVEELEDKSLRSVDLADPEGLAEEFLEKLNDTRVVSANILSEGDVSVEDSDGKRIVVIRVPRATREQRPVFIGKDAFRGSYRRNGEGDYLCPKREVLAMMRMARER